MKTQHTPGPWRADIRLAQTVVVSERGIVADIARHESSTTEQSYSDEEIAANARLISAAPELLEALEQIAARENTADGFERPVLDRKQCSAIARAAIAKAKG